MYKKYQERNCGTLEVNGESLIDFKKDKSLIT